MPAFLTGLLAALLVMLLAVLGGIATPGYSHTSQFISELGATGSTHEWPVRFLGFLPAGAALLAFCGLAHAALPRSRLTSLAFVALAVYALGYIAAAFFPCDAGCRPAHPSPSQRLHNLVGGLG